MAIDQAFEGGARLGAKKSKPGRPSTVAGGPRHQDHAKMNVHILRNVMAMQRRNDQKVVSRARAKAKCKWNHLVTFAKQCPPLPKPPLVRLASEQLLKVLGLNAWGVGSVPRDATSQMEKDEDLQGMIRSTHCEYARQLKTAWDVKYWDRESSKTSRTKQLVDVLDFHESRMINGRVQDQTKAQFVVNAVQVEMQRCHFYTSHHAAKAANATTAYRTKHGIVDTDMG
ncbi:unnamed protein product [Sphagnum jensenii]|uniref:Uncharacterized protein n=1 Tax=Sphagnum jensenii TaxID=128206 RepID=A0ABP0WIH2_9BRYO